VTERASRLLGESERQISELSVLLSTAEEAVLRGPCPGREKLGDGTVTAVALHTADTYLRIAGFIHGHAQHAHTGAVVHKHGSAAERIDPSELIRRLANARRALGALGQLTDEQLDAVPAAGRARFCDGTRTLEEVLASMLRHQGHQIEALRAAVA
jgi:hypothetical protein